VPLTEYHGTEQVALVVKVFTSNPSRTLAIIRVFVVFFSSPCKCRDNNWIRPQSLPYRSFPVHKTSYQLTLVEASLNNNNTVGLTLCCVNTDSILKYPTKENINTNKVHDRKKQKKSGTYVSFSEIHVSAFGLYLYSRTRNSSVGIAISYGQDDRGSIPGWSK
jgi:hypothetical protein